MNNKRKMKKNNNIVHSVVRFTGIEAPARCKSKIAEAQWKERWCLVWEGGGGVNRTYSW
jgi:hypothetical protein